MKPFIKMFALLLLLPVMLAGLATAAQLKGKIQNISNKAKTIQVVNPKNKKVTVIRFGKKTQFVNAKSMKEFIVNDVIVADYEPGQPATKIKRVLVEVPADQLISTKEVAALAPDSYVLVDARPAARYNEGHMPSAISIPADKFSEKMDLLPKDKDKKLVFYCGGPT
ncbi:MAG: rhodanese-like domain-containing protein [SAR324 cluster bacterium]|nr:rhodanese-like domain-containing protein [SAR324 cluster bacterium]